MIYHWKKIKEEKKGLKLVFIHTPKCGGSYINSILRYLRIKRNGHLQATKELQEKYITFTVIREPVERFESFINYRLGEITPRSDWPEYLDHVYNDKSITLNEIIKLIKKKDTEQLHPFKTLEYWTENIDIIITMKDLRPLLTYFGYRYNNRRFKKRNISKKNRGKLNEKSKEKIKEIFKNDIELYQNIVKKLL